MANDVSVVTEAEALREMIRRTRTRLEYFCNEANAGRMPSDAREFMRRVQCGFDSLIEEAADLTAAAQARKPPPAQSGEGQAFVPESSVSRLYRAINGLDGDDADQRASFFMQSTLSGLIPDQARAQVKLALAQNFEELFHRIATLTQELAEARGIGK